MLKTRDDLTTASGSEGRCDSHVWSGDCDHGPGSDSGERYLCARCETVAGLDHEVSHETGSHLSGDYKTLS